MENKCHVRSTWLITSSPTSWGLEKLGPCSIWLEFLQPSNLLLQLVVGSFNIQWFLHEIVKSTGSDPILELWTQPCPSDRNITPWLHSIWNSFLESPHTSLHPSPLHHQKKQQHVFPSSWPVSGHSQTSNLNLNSARYENYIYIQTPAPLPNHLSLQTTSQWHSIYPSLYPPSIKTLETPNPLITSRLNKLTHQFKQEALNPNPNYLSPWTSRYTASRTSIPTFFLVWANFNSSFFQPSQQSNGHWHWDKANEDPMRHVQQGWGFLVLHHWQSRPPCLPDCLQAPMLLS